MASTMSEQPSDGAGAAFLSRLAALGFPEEPTSLPQADMTSALQPSLDHEAELRRLYAQEKTNPKIAGKPYVGLIDVFGAGTVSPNVTIATAVKVDPKAAGVHTSPASAFRIRRRAVDISDIMGSSSKDSEMPKDALPGGPRSDGGTKMDEKYVLPLAPKDRLPHGADAIAPGGLAGFLYRFGVFSEGSLGALSKEDWNGVFVAGNSFDSLYYVPNLLLTCSTLTRRIRHGCPSAFTRGRDQEPSCSSRILS